MAKRSARNYKRRKSTRNSYLRKKRPTTSRRKKSTLRRKRYVGGSRTPSGHVQAQKGRWFTSGPGQELRGLPEEFQPAADESEEWRSAHLITPSGQQTRARRNLLAQNRDGRIDALQEMISGIQVDIGSSQPSVKDKLRSKADKAYAAELDRVMTEKVQVLELLLRDLAEAVEVKREADAVDQRISEKEDTIERELITRIEKKLGGSFADMNAVRSYIGMEPDASVQEVCLEMGIDPASATSADQAAVSGLLETFDEKRAEFEQLAAKTASMIDTDLMASPKQVTQAMALAPGGKKTLNAAQRMASDEISDSTMGAFARIGAPRDSQKKTNSKEGRFEEGLQDYKSGQYDGV